MGAVTQWAVRLPGELAGVVSKAWVGGLLADPGVQLSILADISGYQSLQLCLEFSKRLFLARFKEEKGDPKCMGAVTQWAVRHAG